MGSWLPLLCMYLFFFCVFYTHTVYILTKGNLFPQGINDFIQIAALVNCFNSRDRVTYRTFRKSIFKSRQARLPPFFPPASIRKAFPTPNSKQQEKTRHCALCGFQREQRPATAAEFMRLPCSRNSQIIRHDPSVSTVINYCATEEEM